MWPEVCYFNNKSEVSAHNSLIMYIFLGKSLRTPAGACSLGLITADKAGIYAFGAACGEMLARPCGQVVVVHEDVMAHTQLGEATF